MNTPQTPDFLQTITEDQFQLIERITREYEKGMLALNSLGHHTVTVYGGSLVEASDSAYKNVEKVCELLGEKGWSVVSGGGPGIMTAALNGSKKGGGKAIAFCIDIPGEPPFNQPDVSITFQQFAPRKYLLRQSDAFIFAPGGIGTLDELMEVLTLMKTHKHPLKPVFLLDSVFWKGVTDWFETMLYKERKVINGDVKNLFHIVDTPKEIVEILYHESTH
jgi:uncharacterized protein (TIGR00730 family)